MSLWGLFVLALGLSADAFAVSACKGLAAGRFSWTSALSAGAWFGGFQAVMPLTGWALGVGFASFIASIDHWIAFILLGGIGLNMIRESRRGEACCDGPSFSVRVMAPLALATSIDALAAGVTLAWLHVDVWLVAGFIGLVTFVCSALGVALGRCCGSRLGPVAQLIGGLCLIAMGARILLTHLGLV